MSDEISLLADDLIDGVSILDTFSDNESHPLHNMNYALRVVLNYLIPYYEDEESIARASDLLAKMIRSMEV